MGEPAELWACFYHVLSDFIIQHGVVGEDAIKTAELLNWTEWCIADCNFGVFEFVTRCWVLQDLCLLKTYCMAGLGKTVKNQLHVVHKQEFT